MCASDFRNRGFGMACNRQVKSVNKIASVILRVVYLSYDNQNEEGLQTGLIDGSGKSIQERSSIWSQGKPQVGLRFWQCGTVERQEGRNYEAFIGDETRRTSSSR